MKKFKRNKPQALLSSPLSLLALAVSMHSSAQSSESVVAGQAFSAIEELVVKGRLRDAAGEILIRRMDAEVPLDIISSELIGRIGDSSVAGALRRLPGVTTVDDKFVFVRGLGERYSKSLLNSAEVPSPDLSRSVIPLDLFPTSIVKALSVQKGYSADMPSQFGGGTVNIETQGIPDQFLLSVQFGGGFNSESTGDVLTYNGGSDDRLGEDDGTRTLSSQILAGLETYRGDLSVQGIRNSGVIPGMSIEAAELINREFALALNRDIDVRKRSGGKDYAAQINLGNLWTLDNGLEFGYIGGADYDSGWRNSDIISRKFSNPDEFVEFENESTYNVSLTGHLGFGVRLGEEHSFNTTHIFLRNTDDDTAVVDTFGADDNRPLSGGVGDREYRIRFEQRELETHQIQGEHVWGSLTRAWLGIDALEKLAFADDLKLAWYYSDSTATTEIPNELGVEAETVSDPLTGEAFSSTLKAATKGNYRFTDLDDEVESSGYTLSFPFALGDYAVTLSGGSDYWQKARTYRQLQFALESDIRSGDPILGQPLSTIFGDDNINNDMLGFELDVTGSNSESYIAASKVDAYFGKIDTHWADTLRLTLGLRYEEYQQVGLVWNPLAYGASQVATDPQVLRNSVFVDDDLYLALAATWSVPDFLADTFQLRFSFAETTIRPDLRDISDSSYIDPLTGATVFGNPDVRPSAIDNYDIRAEWFFDSGDNITISAFYKDIVNPIEQFERAAGGTKTALEIINADGGDMAGVEFEFLKKLSTLDRVFEPFFIQGNLVLLEHELTVGDAADAPTNNVRGFVGASDYAANLLLGFDSPDGKHASTLSYNVSDERLYLAGRNGTPDAFEQPFHSVDLTYSYYATDNFSVRVKLTNLLGEDVVIERDGVEVFVEPKGSSFSLSVKYEM